MRKHVRRAALGLTTTALLGTVLTGCGADPDEGDRATQDGDTTASPTAADSAGADAGADASADAGASAQAAASWLSGQLEDGLVITSFEDPPGSGEWSSAPDYGLSLDVFFALEGRDDFADEQAGILDAIEPQVPSYVGMEADAYAGSTGKLVAAVQAAGTDPIDYGQGDLLEKLEGLVVTDGDEQGRAKDTWDPANEFGGDYSNTIGQSWVVRALAEADSDLADETVSFLLAQQCSDGFFRLPMESSDFTCDSGNEEESSPSADATAFAVLALLEVQEAEVDGVQEDVDAALTDAQEWLVSAQEADGSFADADTGQANANSTGVAGEALLALGESDAAAEAAQWLADHQVTEESAEGTELAGEEGAVAYDDAALQKAEKRGIVRADRYQWHRATAQAVATLDALP